MKLKTYKDGIDLPEEVIEYIATHITDNIRELEGALISLLAQSTLNKKEITLDLAKDMIDKLIKNTNWFDLLDSVNPKNTIFAGLVVICCNVPTTCVFENFSRSDYPL